MGLETGTFIDDLVQSNPVGSTDQVAEGDDHIRLVKKVLQNSFPTVTKATYLHQAQADVASMATTDIGAVTSDHVRITGTTTITALGTVGAGVHKTVRFAGALTLTHNGTSLILPGGLNIDTAANDTMECYSLGSGNWIVTSYSRASGLPIVETVDSPLVVRAATTANITIATALNNGDSLDGVTLSTDDLVLVKNQTTASANGVYVVGTSPARHAGYDTYDEHPGKVLRVVEGTTNAGTDWRCSSAFGGTLDSTDIRFLRNNGDVGDLKDFAGSTAPPGWLLCDGSAVAIATYPELNTVIGTTYGDPGGGNINLPDFRGRASVAPDGGAGVMDGTGGGAFNAAAIGNAGGTQGHTLDTTEMPQHNHGLTTRGQGQGEEHTGGNQPSGRGNSPTSSGTYTGMNNEGSSAAHNITQPVLVVNKIILAGV